MAAAKSKLPASVTIGYWAEVRRVLRSKHRLNTSEVAAAVKRYQSTMARVGVGDMLYHALPEETAQGIVTGGYATVVRKMRSAPANGRPASRSTGKRAAM